MCNAMGHRTFPSDNTKLAEMEFYLIEELDFHLIIFHPYRSIVQLCGRDGGPEAGGELGKERRDMMLEMDEQALQAAWFVINDTYRSSLCLVYPPHLIALAAIYLGFAMHPPASDPSLSSPLPLAPSSTTRQTRRSSLTSSGAPATLPRTPNPSSHPPGPAKPILGGKTDPITFLASLNVDHAIVLEIVQEIVSLYELWNALEVETAAKGVSGKGGGGGGETEVDEKVVQMLERMHADKVRDVGVEAKEGRNTGPVRPAWKK